MIRIKRVYDPPSPDDGMRILIDRLWPRGLSKAAAHIDAWIRDAAPSTELRMWFHHDPARWPEFRKRFTAELREHEEAVEAIVEAARKGTVTFVYSSKEEEHNNAAALKEFIEARMHASRRKAA
ncbi:MAG: DUF488 domain-containing protein [Nitrospiraceae bacterium]|nr:DUF488 domain-containing protein [Nitrospiraceae bacterium]